MVAVVKVLVRYWVKGDKASRLDDRLKDFEENAVKIDVIPH